MSISITNPYKHHIQIVVISPTGQQDGIHLQPLARKVKLPEGYNLHQNELIYWPKLRIYEDSNIESNNITNVTAIA